MTEIGFDKYQIKGAYHWVECFGPVHRMNAFTLGRYQIVIDALRDARLGQSPLVLDVGCGDAALSGLLAMQLDARIEGVDVTPGSIGLARAEFARRNLPGHFQLIDSYAYPFPDAAFSAVVCSDVIEHVQKPMEMLAEMWRVLAPDGVLVVTTPVRYTELPLDPMHVQEWFPEQFKRFCQDALGAPVELRLTHPVALVELYASPSPIAGRFSRLAMNLMAKLGYNPFIRSKGFRSSAAQAVIARKTP